MLWGFRSPAGETTGEGEGQTEREGDECERVGEERGRRGRTGRKEHIGNANGVERK